MQIRFGTSTMTNMMNLCVWWCSFKHTLSTYLGNSDDIHEIKSTKFNVVCVKSCLMAGEPLL